MQKKVGGVRVGWGGQGGCERRIEVIVKMKKKLVGVRVGWGGQGGCERRIEIIVKMKKKSGGSGGGKVSVDVKLKLL